MSKRMILILSVVIVMVILTGILVYLNKKGGGTTLGGGNVTLQVWGTYETSANMQQFISDYSTKHSNVHIVYTEKDYSTYDNDLLNALATGTGPDIFSIPNDGLPKYLDKTVPAPDSVMSLKYYNDTFIDAVRNDLTKDGKIYGVALSADSLALYYNKDILGTAGIAVPPKTWDELAKDVRKISRADSSGYFVRSGVAMGTVDNISRAADILYLLMYQNGAVPYTPDNSQSTLDQSASGDNGQTYYPAADAVRFFLSFGDQTSANYTWNSKSHYSVDAFADGQLAFLYGYSFTRDTIVQKAPNLNFDVAPVPQRSLDRNAVNYASYWADVVSKQSQHQDYAWSFLNFMASKDELKGYYTRHKLPSSRKDIIAEQINDPEIGVFANANLTAKTFYKVDPQKVDSFISEMVNSIIHNGESVDTALSTAAQRINHLNVK